MDDIFEGIAGFAVIIGIIIAGAFLYQHFVNPPLTNVSGIVKYDDCREKITLNQTEYSQQNGTFICNDVKTNAGKSMGGECVKTVTDNTGQCQTVYIYQKPADETCGSNEYLTSDDKCYCDYGYVYKGGSCISYNQDCQNSFGINSYGAAGNGTNDSLCYCESGYFWNNDKTSCVSNYTLNQQCVTSYGTGSYSTYDNNGKEVCDCLYGYSWDIQRDSCITTESINQMCRRDFGINSYYLGTVSNGKYNCQSY